MPENDKTCTEEEYFSPHCIQDSLKDGRKKSQTLKETPVKCSNGSEVSGEKHPFVEWSEESREPNPLFCDEITFTVDPIFNKQTDRFVTFGNDVSEHNNQASSLIHMMLGVVPSNGKNVPPVWFEWGHMLTSAINKAVLETNVFSWVMKINEKSDYVCQ